jgi:hypothetical protein
MRLSILPHLAHRIKISRTVSLLPLSACLADYAKTFTFTFTKSKSLLSGMYLESEPQRNCRVNKILRDWKAFFILWA